MPKKHYEQLCEQKILRHTIILGKPIEDIYDFIPEFYREVIECRLKRKVELRAEDENERANIVSKIFIVIVVGLVFIRKVL